MPLISARHLLNKITLRLFHCGYNFPWLAELRPVDAVFAAASMSSAPPSLPSDGGTAKMKQRRCAALSFRRKEFKFCNYKFV